MASTYHSDLLTECIALVKTLQHTPNLSLRQEELYDDLVDIGGEWSLKLAGQVGGKMTTTMLINGLDLILPVPNLTEAQIRIALKSLKRGQPTFMDQEIARRLVDHLFRQEHQARIEEEAIGGAYV